MGPMRYLADISMFESIGAKPTGHIIQNENAEQKAWHSFLKHYEFTEDENDTDSAKENDSNSAGKDSPNLAVAENPNIGKSDYDVIGDYGLNSNGNKVYISPAEVNKEQFLPKKLTGLEQYKTIDVEQKFVNHIKQEATRYLKILEEYKANKYMQGDTVLKWHNAFYGLIRDMEKNMPNLSKIKDWQQTYKIPGTNKKQNFDKEKSGEKKQENATGDMQEKKKSSRFRIFGRRGRPPRYVLGRKK